MKSYNKVITTVSIFIFCPDWTTRVEPIAWVRLFAVTFRVHPTTILNRLLSLVDESP